MIATREPGQSQASAEALARWAVANDSRSDAACEVVRLQAELRRARAVLRERAAAERQATRDYEATPYAESGADA